MAYSVQLDETWLDYPSPDGEAVIVYFCGCEHHCPGCHSQLLQQDYEYAESKEQILEKIRTYAFKVYTSRLVFLGGDPLYSKNIELVKYLVGNLSDEYDICIFTGYDIDYVKSLNIRGVKFWKCGTFDINNSRKSEKNDEEYVLASPNQNFYDGLYNLISNNGILKFNKKGN